MNLQAAKQQELLRLAGIDAELLRLEHQRATLPEQRELDRLETELTTRRDAGVAVQLTIDDLDRDIKKLENELSAVEQREKRDQDLLTAGNVGAKQLSELQHEVGSLGRRRAALEDDLLEVMQRREAAAADYDHAGARLDHTESELAVARDRRDAALADLADTEQRLGTERAALVPQFPADLLAIYERQRKAHGIGAALLRARRCGACRIELDRGELSRIGQTDPDVVVRCPECGAILVRTGESGL